MTLRKAYLYQDDDDDDDACVDAEPEDVAAEIAGLEGDAEIPIEAPGGGGLRGGGAQGKAAKTAADPDTAWPAATTGVRLATKTDDLLAGENRPFVPPGSRAAA